MDNDCRWREGRGIRPYSIVFYLPLRKDDIPYFFLRSRDILHVGRTTAAVEFDLESWFVELSYGGTPGITVSGTTVPYLVVWETNKANRVHQHVAELATAARPARAARWGIVGRVTLAVVL